MSLTKERDNAIKVREELTRDNFVADNRLKHLIEENQILTAKLESLELQEAPRLAPLPAPHPVPRPAPYPAPRAAKQQSCGPAGRVQLKVKLTDVGASNLRQCGARLSTDQVDGIAFVYPGAQFSQMPSRILKTITRSTDVLALHLGTNDALNADTEGQALLGVKSALESVKRNTDIPLVVCAVPRTHNRRANNIRSKINDYLEYECSRHADRMTFVDCGLTLHDIGKDGVHLIPAVKDKVSKAITAAAVGFPKAHSRSLM